MGRLGPAAEAARRKRVGDKLNHIAETLSLKIKGFKHREIAKLQGISLSTVETRISQLKPLLKHIEDYPEYMQRKAEILGTAEMLALKSVVTGLPDATVKDSVYAFKEIFNAGRLERNLSTQNISQRVKYLDMQDPDIID